MLWSKQEVEKEIINIINTYTNSTNINCIFYSINGDNISNENYYNRCKVCKLIKNYDNGENCMRSYIYSALQTEKFMEPTVSFCPYGLVNWTVPIVISGKMKYFITGGPVLLHNVDELLLDHIFKQNPSFIVEKDKLISLLNKIEILSTTHVRHLSELLYRMVKSFVAENMLLLESKRKMDIISVEISEMIDVIKNELDYHKQKGKDIVLYPFEREKELISSIRLGDKKRTREITNDILEFTYAHNDFDLVKTNAISLMVVSARTAIEVGADLETIFEMEFMQIKRILDINNINELRKVLVTGLDKFIESTFSVVDIENKDILFKVINYIRENYKDTTLQDVSEKFTLHPSYLSKLFKKETGISYVEYVNRVKIEASKPLLRGGKSIEEVAKTVGFSNQSYFSKVFKQKEGITPSNWKKTSSIL